MTLNSKENSITSISTRLTQTSKWRENLCKRYPDDERNEIASAVLARLADEARNLTDGQWEALQVHYNWASQRWAEALSEAARHVEFHRGITTFSAFIQDLIRILSEQKADA